MQFFFSISARVTSRRNVTGSIANRLDALKKIETNKIRNYLTFYLCYKSRNGIKNELILFILYYYKCGVIYYVPYNIYEVDDIIKI